MSEREKHYYRMGYPRSQVNNGGGGLDEVPMPRMSMEEFARRRAAFDAQYKPLDDPAPEIRIPSAYNYKEGKVGTDFFVFPETAGRRLLKVIELQHMPQIITERELVSV